MPRHRTHRGVLIMTRSGEWLGAQAMSAIQHRMGSRYAIETIAASITDKAEVSTDWSRIVTTIGKVPLARGYRFELLQRHEIPAVVASLKAWFPEISVGSASCYLRDDFYRDEVCLPGQPEKDVLVVLVKKGCDLVGLFSCDCDRNTLALYARLGVIAPAHRGLGMSHALLSLAESMGRALGMGMIYGMATLKIPHVQRAFETLGWQLIGITPGYDREMVSPGVVKRVYEAVYAKVLVAERKLLRPRARNLTAKTAAFFRLVFPRKRLQRA